MKISFDEYPKKGIMNDEDIRRIHETALKILEEIGIETESPESLDIYEKGGCRVDRDGKRVQIPRELVEDSLQKVPETFKLWNRSGTEATLGDLLGS